MVTKEEISFTEEKKKEVEIPEEFKSKVHDYLTKRAEADKLETEMKKLSDELVELYKKANLKTIPNEKLKYELQCREKNLFEWNEKGTFGIVGTTQYAETVFPIVIDKTLLTDEDIKVAGLWEKCITRRFNPEAMQDLLSKNVFNLKDFIKDKLLVIKTTHHLARVAIKEKKTKGK